jgi:hypothetical protein
MKMLNPLQKCTWWLAIGCLGILCLSSWGYTNRTNGVEGIWLIANSEQGTQKRIFTGKLDIQEHQESFRLRWQNEAGDQQGLGVQVDTILAAAWGLDGKPYGVIIYSPDAKGVYHGLTAASTFGGLTGSEIVKGLKLDPASGTYELAGLEPGLDGFSYTGKLTLVRRGDYYQCRYQQGDSVRKAIGFREGNRLVVCWSEGEKFGAAAYIFDRGYRNATGRWALYGNETVQPEYLSR